MKKNLLLLMIFAATLFSACEEDKKHEELKIEADSISLKKGESKTIAITSGTGKYILNVADTLVAAASLEENNQVKVTGLKQGETSVMVADRISKQKKTLQVTVIKEENLALEMTSIEMEEGETKTVSITSGNGEYAIEVADKEIAKATLEENNIKVEGLKKGETSIKVMDKVSKQEKSLDVKVAEKVIAVESVTVVPDKITVKDNTPFTLEVKIEPENATNKGVRFESNNFDVAVVDEKGVVTPTGTGQVIISVFTNDGNKQAQCKLTVELPLPEGVVIENGLLRAWPCEAVPESGRIVIPDNVTEIRKYTFKGCETLKKVIIPETVTVIGSGAFENCTSLEEITIPGSVKKAGASTFKGCTNLKKVILSEGVEQIFGSYFGNCTNLTEVSLPATTLKKLPKQTFTGCEKLTEITITKGITEIEEPAFLDCNSLVKIMVDAESESFTSENGILFNKTKDALVRYPSGKEGESYEVPTSVTEIRGHAFDRTVHLKTLTIPASVTKVGAQAFYNLNKTGALSVIHCKGTTPPEAGRWDSFDYEGVVKVPAASVEDYKKANGWKDCTIEAAE